MLNPATFEVELPEKGKVEVTTTGLDYIAYEAAYDKPIVVALRSYTGSLFLVHHALHRTGVFDGTLEDFAALTPTFRVQDTDDGEEPVVPLESTQPTG